MPVNARHSSASKRWGTPSDIVERARRVMGRISLDPCTEFRFQQVVKAERCYSMEDAGQDGLLLPWSGAVFCNPPGRAVREFWKKALSEDIEQMIWIGFSIEQLCVLADEDPHPLDFTTCFLRTRLDFQRHDGFRGSPSHANYCTLVAGNRQKFETEFGSLGKITYGKYAI